MRSDIISKVFRRAFPLLQLITNTGTYQRNIRAQGLPRRRMMPPIAPKEIHPPRSLYKRKAPLSFLWMLTGMPCGKRTAISLAGSTLTGSRISAIPFSAVRRTTIIYIRHSREITGMTALFLWILPALRTGRMQIRSCMGTACVWGPCPGGLNRCAARNIAIPLRISGY